jgi:hypothetical protein
MATMAISIGVGALAGGLTVGGITWAMGFSTKVIVLASIGGAIAGSFAGFYLLAPAIATLPTTIVGWQALTTATITGIGKWYMLHPYMNTGGLLGIYALLNYVFPALEERGSNAPDAYQTGKIHDAIDFIATKPGWEELARSIRERKFYVYADSEYSQAYQPHFTTNIHLSEGLIDFDKEILASTIIHEYVHSITSPILKGMGRGEIWAYDLQSQFLKTFGISGDSYVWYQKFQNTNWTYFSDLSKAQKRYLLDDRRSVLVAESDQ